MYAKERKLSLNPYDDLFKPTGDGSEDSPENQREKVKELPLSELHPFKNHPFKVQDDERMADTVESIKEYGVLVPAIARLRAEGGYELVSGHRRKRASELAGLTTMPVLVRELDDDAAVIVMADSNLQRENILPSERAYAYKMKLEAIKRQAGRPAKENCDQVGHSLFGKRSIDVIAESAPDSRNQIQRYIRLTELIPDILQMVDDKKIAFSPAVELSYLNVDEQHWLLDAMAAQEATPSLSQAQRLKKFSQEKHLDENVMAAIMSEEKKEVDRITLTSDKLQKYFPKSYTPKQMEDTIFKPLEQWQKKRQRDREMER